MTRPVVIALTLALLMPLTVDTARAESVVMSIDRATLHHFLRAATPYSFDVEQIGLKETLTLYNPREMRFENGRIRLRVDCKGEPIPFYAELVPTMTVGFDPAKNAFIFTIESLPVKIMPLGTIDLKKYIDPVEIPVTFSSPLDMGVPGLTVDTIVRDIKVLDDRIEARADLIFHRGEQQAATPARR